MYVHIRDVWKGGGVFWNSEGITKQKLWMFMNYFFAIPACFTIQTSFINKKTIKRRKKMNKKSPFYWMMRITFQIIISVFYFVNSSLSFSRWSGILFDNISVLLELSLIPNTYIMQADTVHTNIVRLSLKNTERNKNSFIFR